MSKQSGAVMYVETSAKTSDRSTASAFEVAALSCQGAFSRQSSVISTSPMTSSSNTKTRPSLLNRRDRSEPRVRGSKLVCLNPYNIYQSPLDIRSRTASLSSTSLHSKSSTLSSTKSTQSTQSNSSVISITTTKTPLVSRRSEKKDKNAKTVTIKCQRLNIHREVEEVEIQVPATVYHNIKSDSEVESNLVRNCKERRSLGSKLRRLILKD
eukprot:TRINITY_DN5858_c0_g1_i8.p1 TRINITY_DN5858_c0_g1~~TRINITY_DN5858_c0_g1_i8.p1  ORF type:complete len:244 (-),score=51.48 TRINITY_DN5858_c0_g1_i8:104-736(-)